ncbi:hypothetical protein B0H21DRAFT_722451 [Amylocystis lapponica]|nr:hypothetical protein B0H21DRAFT_722451 [Amylocystis lapponica]
MSLSFDCEDISNDSDRHIVSPPPDSVAFFDTLPLGWSPLDDRLYSPGPPNTASPASCIGSLSSGSPEPDAIPFQWHVGVDNVAYPSLDQTWGSAPELVEDLYMQPMLQYHPADPTYDLNFPQYLVSLPNAAYPSQPDYFGDFLDASPLAQLHSRAVVDFGAPSFDLPLIEEAVESASVIDAQPAWEMPLSVPVAEHDSDADAEGESDDDDDARDGEYIPSPPAKSRKLPAHPRSAPHPRAGTSARRTARKDTRAAARQEGSAPYPTAGRLAGSSKPSSRNIVLSLEEAAVYSRGAPKAVDGYCRVCGKEASGRPADFKRHFNTHMPTTHHRIFCGVPREAAEAAGHYFPDDEVVCAEGVDGLSLVAGCGQGFSRSDAWQRHARHNHRQAKLGSCRADGSVVHNIGHGLGDIVRASKSRKSRS